MEREEILKLTVAELKAQLVELGLKTPGRKDSLQDRLCEHYGLTIEDEADERVEKSQEDNHNSVDEVAENENQNVATPICTKVIEHITPFTLTDIEYALTSFSGSGQPTVTDWLEDFESNAAAVPWNEL